MGVLFFIKLYPKTILFVYERDVLEQNQFPCTSSVFTDMERVIRYIPFHLSVLHAHLMLS